jgi:hypothetical protein
MPIIYGEKQKDVTGNGHFMETQAWINTDTGHAEAITHTFTTNWVFGFTGGVAMVFLDAAGMPIARTDAHSFGVDARGVFFKPSSRTDSWAQDIDAGVASRVGNILIVHTHAPHNRLGEILEELIAYQNYALAFCQQFPDLCSELGGIG